MKAFAVVEIGNAFLPKNSVFLGAGGTIGSLVTRLLPLIYLIATILTALYFLYGAIQFIYSGGDPKAKEAARKKIQYAVLGFTLVALSFLLVQFLSRYIHISPTERFSCIDTYLCPGNPNIGGGYYSGPQTTKPDCADPFPEGPCQTADCMYWCFRP